MPRKTTKKTEGTVGPRTRVWDRSGLWGEYQIGSDCTIARFVEIGDGVRIGDRVKVEASACPPPGVTLEDDASHGPHATFTNDRRPRARGEWERAVRRRDAPKGAQRGGPPRRRTGP